MVKPTNDQLLDELYDELQALLRWRRDDLPEDVALGVDISVDKITTILERAGRLK